MRLLHTSDWHLGRLFHKVDLLDEQSQAIDRIIEIAVDQQVDAVVIAGDIFDRAIPPLGAVALLGDALTQLRATGASIVAISGNHDSATRLGMLDPLLTASGVTVRGDVARLQEPIVLQPADGGSPVAIYPVPFLDPSTAGHLLGLPTQHDGGDDARRTARCTHHDVTAWALDLVRSDAAARGDVRSVVVAHTFVRGGAESASERELTMGNVDQVDIGAFAGIGYVALGHLHGAQSFDGGRIAYSGTPLPYSFSEEHQTKSVRIVDIAATGEVSAEAIPLGVGRPLRTISGTLDELLTDGRWLEAEGARVRALVTDLHLPMRAMARVQERFPHAVELRHEPPSAPDGSAPARLADPTRPPLELAAAFWADQTGQAPTDDERALLEHALAAATRSVDGGSA